MKILKRPSWCLESEIKEFGISNCEFKTCSKETIGSSCFCIGKTKEISFSIEGYNHVNGWLFCTRTPYIKDDHPFNTYVQIVNKNDMEILHKLLHKAGHIIKDIPHEPTTRPTTTVTK